MIFNAPLEMEACRNQHVRNLWKEKPLFHPQRPMTNRASDRKQWERNTKKIWWLVKRAQSVEVSNDRFPARFVLTGGRNMKLRQKQTIGHRLEGHPTVSCFTVDPVSLHGRELAGGPHSNAMKWMKLQIRRTDMTNSLNNLQKLPNRKSDLKSRKQHRLSRNSSSFIGEWSSPRVTTNDELGVSRDDDPSNQEYNAL